VFNWPAGPGGAREGQPRVSRAMLMK